MNNQWCRYLLLLCLGLFFVRATRAATPEGQAPQFVKQLDIIHFSHTDYGFTDHPAVCRDLQRRYLDLALDAAHEHTPPARGGAVPLDRRNDRGGGGLVAGGLTGAAPRVPESPPRRPTRGHRVAPQ